MSFRPDNAIDFGAEYDNLREVEVVDALMGRGKTTAAIKYIEDQVLNDPGACWMLCCGPLAEVNSRPYENKAMEHYWHAPKDTNGTKEASLIELLQDRNVRLIVLTHKLWKDATTNPVVLHHIDRRRFSILFDEVPDNLVELYKGIRTGDFIRAHAKGELVVHEDQFGRIEWKDQEAVQMQEALHVDSLVRNQRRVRVFINGGQYTVLDMPDERGLKVFRRVLVTTYLVERTAFTCYLGMIGVGWSHSTNIVPSRPMTKAQLRGLVHLEPKYDKQFEKWKLDSTWYAKTATAAQLSAIGNAIRNLGDRLCDGNPTRLAFTGKKKRVARTQKAPGVKARGYTSFLYLPGKARTDTNIDKHGSCFIRCNAKASNEYRHKDVLVHAYNRFPLEPVRRFFHGHGLDFDSEHFALTELLQWVWRSAVRDGKPIQLAILSERMRNLFKAWLAEEDSNVIRFPVPRIEVDQPAANEQTLEEWMEKFG